jgi:hypothetical protein
MIRRILLYDIADVHLVVGHPSGVLYRNQVGGTINYQAEIEGVLCPFELSNDASERLQNYHYPSGRQGLAAGIADAIDTILASEPVSRTVRVDRSRLEESWEAWVHVLIESPSTSALDLAPDSYHGAIYGFGNVTGVLTWPNSD